MYTSFIKFLRCGWTTFERCTATPFAPAVFLYLHTALVWQEMCNNLKITITRLSFDEIRGCPSMARSERLHEMRENLFYMRQSLAHSAQVLQRFKFGMSDEDEEKNARELRLLGEIYSQLQDLRRDFEAMLDEANRLDEVVRHSFDVLMSTIVVRDTQLSQKNSELGIQHSKLGIEQSKIGLEQAASVKVLTQLAFLYIPLTFASGIFGMNLQELNGTGQHVWVFLVACLVAVVVTPVLLVIMRSCLAAPSGKARDFDV